MKKEVTYHILDKGLFWSAAELRDQIRDHPVEEGEVILKVSQDHPHNIAFVSFVAGDSPEDFPDEVEVDDVGDPAPFKVGDTVSRLPDARNVIGERDKVYTVEHVFRRISRWGKFEWWITFYYSSLARVDDEAELYEKVLVDKLDATAKSSYISVEEADKSSFMAGQTVWCFCPARSLKIGAYTITGNSCEGGTGKHLVRVKGLAQYFYADRFRSMSLGEIYENNGRRAVLEEDNYSWKTIDTAPPGDGSVLLYCPDLGSNNKIRMGNRCTFYGEPRWTYDGAPGHSMFVEPTKWAHVLEEPYD